MDLPSVVTHSWQRLRSSETRMRLSKALLWGSFATILGRGLPIVAMMVTAHFLGPVAFGKFTLLYSTTVALEVFVSAGFSMTCTKFVADLHRQDPLRTGRILDLADVVTAITAVLFGIFIVSLAPTLARDVLVAPDLTGDLYWSVVLIAILAFSGVRQGALVGLEAFRAIALTELAGGLAIFLFVSLGVIMYGMQGAFGGMMLGYGLRLVAQHLALAREASERGIPRQWALPMDELSVLWRFSLPGMLNSLLWGPVTWCAMAIIAHQPNGHAEVGIFSAANQWFSVLMFLPTVINQAAFPILTERLYVGAAKSAWKLFYGQMMVILGTLTPLVLAIALSSRYIMGVYGVEYGEKWQILLLVAIAAWFAAPQGPMGNLLLAHAKPWSWFVASLVWAGCLLLVVTIWRDHGALSLAWAYVASYAARGLYVFVRIYQLRTNV